MGLVKLELQKELARHLRGGHPWVYRRALEKPPADLAAGAIVDVTERGKFVARGYFDPSSAVRVRILTRDPAEAIGPLFWRRRIARAVALRRTYAPFEGETDCARLVHGEGDGLPGVVVDLYAKWAVLKLYSKGLVPHRPHILDALRAEVGLEGIYGRDEEVEVAADEEEERGSAPRLGSWRIASRLRRKGRCSGERSLPIRSSCASTECASPSTCARDRRQDTFSTSARTGSRCAGSPRAAPER